MTNLAKIACVLAAVLLGGCASARDEPFRAASFNIRSGIVFDGADRWSARRHRVMEMIEELDADVLAVQEARSEQVREILEAHPRYVAIGAHRGNGKLGGEGVITLIDTDRFMIAEAGVFALSDEPDRIGSISWDNRYPRICAWSRLIDMETGEAVRVYNLHLDNRGRESRELSADLVRRHIEARAGDDPVLVLGDFNATESSEPVGTLIAPDESGRELRDSFAAVNPGNEQGTYTGFNLKSDAKRRIDFVLVDARLGLLDAGVDSRKIDGRYPSDHFPVWADVSWDGRVLARRDERIDANAVVSASAGELGTHTDAQ